MFKCDDCQFTCGGKTTLRKHKNTKHPKCFDAIGASSKMVDEKKDTDHTKNEKENKNSIDFEEEMILYQIELVEGGVVLVCNLCDEGFEMDNNIEKHLEDIPNKT